MLQIKQTAKQPVVCQRRSWNLSDEYARISIIAAPDIQIGTVIHCAVTLVYPIVVNVTGMKYVIVIAVVLTMFRIPKTYILTSVTTALIDSQGVNLVLVLVTDMHWSCIIRTCASSSSLAEKNLLVSRGKSIKIKAKTKAKKTVTTPSIKKSHLLQEIIVSCLVFKN